MDTLTVTAHCSFAETLDDAFARVVAKAQDTQNPHAVSDMILLNALVAAAAGQVVTVHVADPAWSDTRERGKYRRLVVQLLDVAEQLVACDRLEKLLAIAALAEDLIARRGVLEIIRAELEADPGPEPWPADIRDRVLAHALADQVCA